MMVTKVMIVVKSCAQITVMVNAVSVNQLALHLKVVCAKMGTLELLALKCRVRSVMTMAKVKMIIVTQSRTNVQPTKCT
jgi:hypothetical protein